MKARALEGSTAQQILGTQKSQKGKLYKEKE